MFTTVANSTGSRIKDRA